MPKTEAEVRQLRRDLSIARQERDILKKAIQIFSKEQSRCGNNSFIKQHSREFNRANVRCIGGQYRAVATMPG